MMKLINQTLEDTKKLRAVHAEFVDASLEFYRVCNYTRRNQMDDLIREDICYRRRMAEIAYDTQLTLVRSDCAMLISRGER